MAIAHELAKKQRKISVAEFFEKNRHLLGFENKRKALLTCVKEAVDNSLDACEDAQVLPEIIVEVKRVDKDRYKVVVEDNGPGIIKEQIPHIFGSLLYGSKFHSWKQSRGQQGIGISASVLYSQLTTGKPAVIISRVGKEFPAYKFELMINVLKNEPEVLKEEEIWEFRDHGTRVELELEGTYSKNVLEYIRRTWIVNPYSNIIFFDPEGNLHKFKRVVNQLPKLPKEIKPHPYGLELGILIRMLKNTTRRNLVSFLMEEFSRIGRDKAIEILEKAGLDRNKKPTELSKEEAEKLLKAMQSVKIYAPPTDCLSPIGEKEIEKALKEEFKPEFVTALTRKPVVYRGIPFQIEVGIAYGGEIKNFELLRYANKVPLLYEQSACAITKAVSDVNWKDYGLESDGKLPTSPVAILVHMASVWVPYTSEGKNAIASYPIIIKEIKLALQEAARKLRLYVVKKRKAQEEEKKLKKFMGYGKEVALSLSILLDKPEEEIWKIIEKRILERMKYGSQEEISGISK